MAQLVLDLPNGSVSSLSVKLTQVGMNSIIHGQTIVGSESVLDRQPIGRTHRQSHLPSQLVTEPVNMSYRASATKQDLM